MATGTHDSSGGPAAVSAIGIDIGGTNIRAGRVAADGTILARASAPSSPDPQHVLARCLALAAEVQAPEVVALGMGLPGQVDVPGRRMLSGGFVNLAGIDLPGAVMAATGLPLTVDNDAGMALAGEAARGAGAGCDALVMLTIGTGIGGAIMEGGRILRGAGLAGQLGHLVTEPDGLPCVCGRRGCIETVSSGTAFAAHLARHGLPAGTRAGDLLARPDDAVARAVIAAWAGPLRRAIDTLVAIANPQRVILGGGAGAAMAAALATLPVAPSWFDAPVVAATLGDDAGMIGAALSALRAEAASTLTPAIAPAPAAARRLVMVNGVPASGKSGVARALSARTGWPVLALDTIKNPFLARLPPADRLFNRTLGQASYDAIFDLLRDAPAGSTFIVDAWFGFQPVEVLEQGLRRAGVTHLAEVWCTAPPEAIGARYAARVDRRPAGHPGLDYVPELVALAGRAAPTGLAPLHRVETTTPLDLPALVGWLDALWPAPG